VVEGGLDVSAEEFPAQAEPPGQVEDDLQVRPGLVDGRDHGPAVLRPGAGVLGQGVRRRAGQHRGALPAAGRGQQQVGQGAAGVGEQVDVDVEAERLQGLPAEQRVRVREQRVGAERDHGPDRVGLPGQDDPVHVGRADQPRSSGRAQRALGVAEAARRLPGREQLMPGDRAGGGGGEQDVAAAPIELAGQGVEHADRPVGLHGVGALLQPGPGVVAGWLLAGEQPRRPADLAGRHPGDGLGPLRGVPGRQLPEQVQGGPAADGLPSVRVTR
jgi:hypothetical protein